MKAKKSKFKNIRVLLIEGRARQVMPMMKALSELCCHITTYNSNKMDLGYVSRYPDKKIIRFCNDSDKERTIENIREELMTMQYDIVIPLNDYVAILLSQNKEQLSRYAQLAVNDWDVFRMASDKLNTMRVCMEYGIPCPITQLVENPCDVRTENFNFPVVVKPRTGYAAVGFSKVDVPGELNQVLMATYKKYGVPLVQEYIPQTDLQYKAELYVDKNGFVKSACVFAKLRWYPIDGGSSTLNVTVDRPDIVETCVKLLSAINWRGYADVDLIQDPRDSTAKVMEINPRITGSVKICFAVGINFAKQILEDLLGESVTEYMEYKKGQYLRYMHTDLLWFLKSKNRFNIKPNWFDFRNSTDQIFSVDDPLPFFAYTIQGLGRFKKERDRRSLPG